MLRYHWLAVIVLAEYSLGDTAFSEPVTWQFTGTVTSTQLTAQSPLVDNVQVGSQGNRILTGEQF